MEKERMRKCGELRKWASEKRLTRKQEGSDKRGEEGETRTRKFTGGVKIV